MSEPHTLKNPFRSILRIALPLEELIYHSLSIRKSLLLICRANHNPYHDRHLDTRLWRNTRGLWSILYGENPKLVSDALDLVLYSPFRVAVLKSWILSAPVSHTQQSDIRRDALTKELSAMESTPREASINWSSILQGSADFRLDDSDHPYVNSTVHNRVHLWASRLEKRVLYPHYGTKLLAIGSTSSLPLPFYPDGEISSMQAEQWYMRTGEQGFGPSQMKQAWKTAHLVPRTYYAQGLTAYHSSKYLRDPFNELADLFRNINRFQRTRPQLIVAERSDALFVYDLTSFTSMFHEHRSFLLALATEVEGYLVTYYDSHNGFSYVTLSALIREYVQLNVDCPSYVSLLLPFDEILELHHNVAGFLGTYGNLVTCTIPHGICLASVDDSYQNNWCAGDDAGIATKKTHYGRLHRTTHRVGSYVEDKVFLGEEDGAVALKRPVKFDRGFVLFRSQPMFPLLGMFFDPKRFDLPSDHDPIRALASSTFTFFLSCKDRSYSDEDKLEILRYIGMIFIQVGLPLDGWLPQVCGYARRKYAVPIIGRDSFEHDPFDHLVEKYYMNRYSSDVREEMIADTQELFDCGETSGNMTPRLKWLRDMGFVYAEAQREEYFGVDGLLRLRSDLKIVTVPYVPIVYRFTVVDSIPSQHTRPSPLL